MLVTLYDHIATANKYIHWHLYSFYPEGYEHNYDTEATRHGKSYLRGGILGSIHTALIGK
jgi:hypothetical protein